MARVNTTKAVQAWRHGKHYRAPGRNGSSIWTAGGILYSYSTPIGKWSDAQGDVAILNMTRYSCTTTIQQRGVQQLLSQYGLRFIECESEDVFKNQDRL